MNMMELNRLEKLIKSLESSNDLRIGINGIDAKLTRRNSNKKIVFDASGHQHGIFFGNRRCSLYVGNVSLVNFKGFKVIEEQVPTFMLKNLLSEAQHYTDQQVLQNSLDTSAPLTKVCFKIKAK